MFNDLTKEIIYLSMIPVAIIVLIDLIAFFVMRKKEKSFRFNYLIKISLMIANSFVLPLIGGYSLWIILKYVNEGVLINNMMYVSLLIFLWIVLLTLFIWIYMKTNKELNEDRETTVEE